MSILFIFGAGALIEGLLEFISDRRTHAYMRTHTKRFGRA